MTSGFSAASSHVLASKQNQSLRQTERFANKQSRDTTHRMRTPDIQEVADDMNLDLAMTQKASRSRIKIIQPSYIQMTHNKLNNPDLLIDQPVLQSIYYRRSYSPVVKGEIKKQIKAASLGVQTDKIDLSSLDKPPYNHCEMQTEPIPPSPDDELRRKLMEYIGGKIAK